MWAKDRGACCKCRIEEGYGEYDMGHTPGPWVVAGDSIHDRETKYESDGARTGDTACRIATTEIMARQGEQEANVRLIAAAPEMLEALQEAYLCVVGTNDWLAKMIGDVLMKAAGRDVYAHDNL